MKTKFLPLLLAAMLLLTGCTATFDANADVPAANAPMDSFQSVSAASQDPFPQPAPEPAPEQTEPLTKEQAQAAALTHAGLSADQVTRLEVEYEIDDGIPRYEVQFRYDGWEYDYKIHAETGAILSFDRDRD